MIGQPRFYGRSDAKRRVDAAELIEGHVEGNRVFQIPYGFTGKRSLIELTDANASANSNWEFLFREAG